MAMKNDAKFEEKKTFYFKIYMKNLTNINASTQKSQKFALSWAAFDQSIYCLSLESTEELCLMALKIDANFEGKLTCAFKLTLGIWQNFTRGLKSLKIGTLEANFYPK